MFSRQVFAALNFDPLARKDTATVLYWRLISSAVIISTLIAAIFMDLQWGRAESINRPGIMTVGITTLLAILAGIELDRLTSDRRRWQHRLPLVVAVVTVVVLSAVPVFYVPYPANCPIGRLGWPVIGMLVGLALLFGKEMAIYGRESTTDATDLTVGPATRRLGIGTLAMVYIGLPLAIITQIRLLGSNAFGMWALLSIIVIPKMADAGAYFTGHAIGKHKLVPRLSPGKTIEGLCGGLVTGVLGAVMLWYLIGPWLFGIPVPASFGAAVVYGILLSVISVFGDLAESLIKRDCQIKDSSHLLPGLGGVLDVIDSILTAAPAAYAFWMVVEVPKG